MVWLFKKNQELSLLRLTIEFVKKQTGDASLLDVLKKDFEETGKCNMEMGKESYIELHLAWASQKKSPYLNPLNKRFYLEKKNRFNLKMES